MKIARAPDGILSGQLYSVGKGRDIGPILLSPMAVNGSDFTFEDWSSNYKGEISKDAKSIKGAFDLGGSLQAVTFVRASDKLPTDPSPHRVKLIPVEKGISLEVLDWGGSGSPLVLLSGNFNTAHVFDDFAQRFTANHHVYGITRRGFGISSAPPLSKDNYDSDRLGDDVLAVMSALKIEKPFLAGHSIGGEELSSIGTRHPEKVSGLIYLDSAYSYAFYDFKPVAAMTIDTAIVARDLDQLWAAEPSARGAIIQELQTMLPNLQRGLQWAQAELPNQEDWLANQSPQERAGELIVEAGRKYTDIKPPILAIYASPHQCQPNCDKVSPTSSRQPGRLK